MFLHRSVCLCVCLSDNWKSCERILTKFLGGVWHGPGTKCLNFGDDLDHRPDPGVRSPKSGFTGLSKKLPADFDEILWRAGVWLRDQLFTFWWRSASLPGSRESVPDHDPDPKRTVTILLCLRSAEVCALWVLLVLTCNHQMTPLLMHLMQLPDY